jgi:hypothetical protein
MYVSLYILKNDPHAGSPTSTLLRLLPLLDWEYCQVSAKYKVAPASTSRCLYSQSITGNDGRCVQEPGTYSLRSDETRIQDIPRSWRIITIHQSPSRLRLKRFPNPFGPGCHIKAAEARWLNQCSARAAQNIEEHHRPALGSCFNALMNCIIPISKRPARLGSRKVTHPPTCCHMGWHARNDR